VTAGDHQPAGLRIGSQPETRAVSSHKFFHRPGVLLLLIQGHKHLPYSAASIAIEPSFARYLRLFGRDFRGFGSVGGILQDSQANLRKVTQPAPQESDESIIDILGGMGCGSGEIVLDEMLQTAQRNP
jgi:hypothetical protein